MSNEKKTTVSPYLRQSVGNFGGGNLNAYMIEEIEKPYRLTVKLTIQGPTNDGNWIETSEIPVDRLDEAIASLERAKEWATKIEAERLLGLRTKSVTKGECR